MKQPSVRLNCEDRRRAAWRMSDLQRPPTFSSRALQFLRARHKLHVGKHVQTSLAVSLPIHAVSATRRPFRVSSHRREMHEPSKPCLPTVGPRT